MSEGSALALQPPAGPLDGLAIVGWLIGVVSLGSEGVPAVPPIMAGPSRGPS